VFALRGVFTREISVTGDLQIINRGIPSEIAIFSRPPCNKQNWPQPGVHLAPSAPCAQDFNTSSVSWLQMRKRVPSLHHGRQH